jgi:hypothetical protein
LRICEGERVREIIEILERRERMREGEEIEICYFQQL